MGSTYEAQETRYEKGDRVWVLRGGATREPGVVIGHYVDWNLYRVVYTVDLEDQGPRIENGASSAQRMRSTGKPMCQQTKATGPTQVNSDEAKAPA